MLNRLFPAQADNHGYQGYRAALWLMGAFIALKLIIGFNSLFNTASVAQGADGIPLDSFPPAAATVVLSLFAKLALGQLVLALVGLAILVRWRALVPFYLCVSLGEQLARRFVGAAAAPGGAPAAGGYVTAMLLALLALGLVLSLLRARRPAAA